MSCTPHTWIDGETITAAKMNAIEEGIEEAASSGGGGVPWVHITTNTGNTVQFGEFAIATLDNGIYSLVTAAWSWPMLISAPGLSDFYVNCQCPMPSASDLYLVFVDFDMRTITRGENNILRAI